MNQKSYSVYPIIISNPMKNLKKMIACLAGAALTLNVNAQDTAFVHEQSETSDYVWPTDQKVLEKLDQWQDLKFGVLFHWGIYSVPGICESWGLCSEDVEWLGHKQNYVESKKKYYSNKDKFNPVNFDPSQWADVMQDAGMKYMIFTTKHHDGFCLFDSKYTDFSVKTTPFGKDPRMNVAYHVFDAFRQKNFMIGCYFSKPDWHCEWYWNPLLPTPTRRENYKRKLHPDWWKNYQDFTANQLNELMSDYGKFDILWLDGGWVTGDEIGLDGVLEKARVNNPGLISVDRTIRGKNENYQTPEGMIPKTQLNIPWESCITMGYQWGWAKNPKLKSSQKILNTLIEIVAKGGCYVLGVGPTPDGLIQPEVAERLHVVGEWLRANGKAIYSTRNAKVYNSGNTWFTANKDGKTIYAIYALPEGENLPATIEWEGNLPKGRMSLVANNRTVSYKCQGNKVIVRLPRGLKNEAVALQFKLK